MVISIMLIITGAVLIRQARFNSATLLRSLSYSIALSIRSAQVYGTSVRGTASSGTCASGTYVSGICYASAYGVYFNGPNSYLLFADLNNNGTYDSGTDAVVQSYQVGGGFTISKFCGIHNDQSRHCNTDSSAITWLSIYFKRPNPDALVQASSGEPFNGAYVEISSLSDPTNVHCISVAATGEIAVLPPAQCS